MIVYNLCKHLLYVVIIIIIISTVGIIILFFFSTYVFLIDQEICQSKNFDSEDKHLREALEKEKIL